MDTGGATSDELGAISAPLLGDILRNRGRIRARLESVVWRAAAAGEMARRTERFLNFRAQYSTLSKGERRDLGALYGRLVAELRGTVDLPAEELRPALDAVTTAHLERLVSLVQATGHGDEMAAAIRGESTSICAAYRPTLQLAVLDVDPATVPQPVLDVGAGADGALVAHLRERGVDAYGIDRLADGSRPYLEVADWFEYDVGQDRWGAILSHMGFSNHLLRHHRNGEEEAFRYTARYVQLLRALRVGGRFHYAPAVPFLEGLLAPRTYDARYRAIPGVALGDAAISRATTITRLR